MSQGRRRHGYSFIEADSESIEGLTAEIHQVDLANADSDTASYSDSDLELESGPLTPTSNHDGFGFDEFEINLPEEAAPSWLSQKIKTLIESLRSELFRFLKWFSSNTSAIADDPNLAYEAPAGWEEELDCLKSRVMESVDDFICSAKDAIKSLPKEQQIVVGPYFVEMSKKVEEVVVKMKEMALEILGFMVKGVLSNRVVRMVTRRVVSMWELLRKLFSPGENDGPGYGIPLVPVRV